jgi:hypothetical protein
MPVKDYLARSATVKNGNNTGNRQVDELETLVMSLSWLNFRMLLSPAVLAISRAILT